MKRTVVLTGVGRDRIGIVAELTHLLFELGCNLLDSSMTLLRGEFALILMCELPDSKSIEQLEESLHGLESQLGMTVHVREMSEEELREADAAVNSFMVSVYGADKPGIVARVTKSLATAAISITDVQTKSINDLFVMLLEVSAPPSVSGDSVRNSLKQIATELSVDITVQTLEAVEL